MRDLDPSYFALVMATGIVSRAMRLDGAAALSDVLLAVALAVFVVLYVVVAVLVATARLEFPLRPADPTVPYWVFMGATAISVLAGSQILRLRDDPLALAVHAAASGLSIMMWAFGTWLVPLLVALAVWRHLLCHVSLRYEPAFWAVVFPVGMYGVASRELGAVLHVSWLVTLGRYEAWVALATWTAVVAAMTASALRRRGQTRSEE